MDLEVVGRHALLFDDDPMAAFVNSADALVEWHSLQIDRYDVRHLLSAPPPPRRRTRNFESKSSDEILMDQERYLDLPPDSDQPEVEDEEKPSASDSYHTVGFSYGNTDDSADQKNTDGMESVGYVPPFPVPGNIVQSLPPTEKVHQIIARTALFVSKNGGQSEIILRVKQGDNPTFGFLMPDHHLHAYFKYLVNHPELMHTEFDEKSQDERKKAGNEHDNLNSVGGALSLLGSVYGSGEDEDGDDAVNPSATHDSEKVESVENAVQDEPIFKKPFLFNKENVPAVKKNSSIVMFKPKSLKSSKKDGSSGLYSTAEDKSKNDEIGVTSKPPIVEPPPEFKRLIDKLVEFVMRNGKQFEATLLEQDSKHMRFPFLLPSNQYHPYYKKVLQAAQESKVNGKSYSGKDDLGGHGINKKASVLRGYDSSHASDFGDVPFESDRKEKFKMVIGKSRKEEHETTERGTQESGVTVDAAAAVAILEAATRGIKNSDSHNHLHRSGSGDASSESNLTEEQKRKAERLKKAKMFVAMLKSGAGPIKSGTSRDPSVEPLESGALKPGGEVKLNDHERESSLPPAVVNKTVGTVCLGERQLSKRKYRSKTGEDSDTEEHEEDEIDKKNKNRGESSEDDRHHKRCKTKHQSQRENDGFEGKYKEERERKHKRKHRSRSRRHKEDDEVGNAVEKERKHRRRRSRSRSSSEESENEEESNESDRESKRYKLTHREKKHHHESGSRRKHEEENGEESSGDEDKDHKRSRKSHHSRDRSSRSKKHRSHRSKHRHRSRERESRHHQNHDRSSDDERGELEEGEISSKVEDECRGITNDDRVDAVRSSQEMVPSQPSDNTDIPADLRAKIRAMLMATRS